LLKAQVVKWKDEIRDFYEISNAPFWKSLVDNFVS